MTAFTKILAGSVAIAAVASAAPAAAQYPGYGYGSGSGGGIIGQVINSVIGGGYGSGYGSGYGQGYGQNYGYNGYNNSYGQNPYSRYGSMGQTAITQCMGAVQQRLSASYPYANGYQNNGYQNGYQNGYGYQQQQYGGYNGARVLGISDIDQRSNGGLSIRGVANSGRNAGYGNGGGYGGYGNGYNSQAAVDLTFRCKTDASGYIVDIDIEQATSAYGYSNNRAYTPYNYDYSQYGYRRY